jgi:glycosyltransferase involved in cell wall biosynthesis
MRAHNVESLIWERMAANESAALKKWYIQLQAGRLKQYEIAQLNLYDAIVPITNEDRQILVNMGATVPMFTSPAGIDLERFEGYDNPVEQNTIGFIGGLDWLPNQEGLQWLIKEVWPEVHGRQPQLQLHIAGRNAPGWLQTLQLPGIKVVGEVEDALDFISRRQLMVVPLFSGSGMRIKIIEAMAMEKAVISTTIGAEGILYTAGDDILIANTKEEYIDTILKCIDQPAISAAIGKKARQLIESRYDNLKFAAALAQFYTGRFF